MPRLASLLMPVRASRMARGLGCALLGLLLVACGGSNPLPPVPSAVDNPADVVWNLEEKGLRLRMEAASDLNMQNNVPLGITMCVYQLKNFAAFQNAVYASGGIDKLLNCAITDVTDAVSATLYELQPGSQIDITTSRLEEARYLGVVAGYTHLQPEMCSAVQPFAMHKSRSMTLSSTYRAAKMDILIRLTSQAINISGVERVQ